LGITDNSEEKVFKVEEGKSILIELPAKANPPDIDYKWTLNGKGNIPGFMDSLTNLRLFHL
jgi:hypothetical protein